MTRITWRRFATSLRVVAVLVGACLLAGVANLAYASVTTTHAARKHAARKHADSMLAVFRHPDRRVTAHVAARDFVPSSAVLAATDGDHELYVWEGGPRSASVGDELCIGDGTQTNVFGVACGSIATVTHHGIVWISTSKAGVNIDMLLPNGVGRVQIGNHDGTSSTLSVSNNVAELEDANIASVTYKLANGATIIETIPVSATELGVMGG
jgi:hypothetical protein